MLTYSMPSLKASLVRLHIGSGAHGRQAELGIGAGSLRKMAVSRWNCTLEHVGRPGNIWQLQISSLKMLGVINLYKMKILCWDSTYLLPILPVSSYLILSISPLASINPSCWWGIVPCCHLPRSRVQLRQIECLRQSKQHPVSFRRWQGSCRCFSCWSLVNLTVSKYFHKKMLTYVDIIQALIYVDICWY